MLHEERFERNPSKKFAVEHHSSVQEFQIRLSHVWRRLPCSRSACSPWHSTSTGRMAHGMVS